MSAGEPYSWEGRATILQDSTGAVAQACSDPRQEAGRARSEAKYIALSSGVKCRHTAGGGRAHALAGATGASGRNTDLPLFPPQWVQHCEEGMHYTYGVAHLATVCSESSGGPNQSDSPARSLLR